MKKNKEYINVTSGYFICIILLGFVILEFILNLTPPISRDALVHHLAIPKLWIKHGGFYETTWANYSYYPMNINLFYLICLYFKNDIVPKFIHLGFGLGTGWLIYLYLKQKIDRNSGLLGMLIFISTPIVIWLSTSAYIDLGMTFFTTASVLAFVKWRDSDYIKLKWIIISSLCMGIAIGSKYNALIAWFFINLIIVHSYVRDTQKQMVGIKYGLIFFALTVIAASPWYIKNYLLTENPFYPLFNSFFNPDNQLLEKTSSLSFFHRRQIMYDETFWETLLIPLRMFFQGEDNSYRYFQGVLNPILIVFSPFILLNKREHRDKFLFAFFSVFFIIIAYFFTAKQVRYILPVIPFLTIIAVMGIKYLSDWLKDFAVNRNIKITLRSILFTSLIILLVFNLSYLIDRINVVQPFSYVFGKETKEEFLRRHLDHYDAIKYINKHLPDDAVLFTMFIGRRAYYLDRSYKNEPSFGMNTIKKLVSKSINEKKFSTYIRSMEITHILMKDELVDKYLQDNFLSDEITAFMNLVKKYWKLIYKYNGYSIYYLKISPTPL
ncbi:Phospholipid carrier-dependent glycosyltransferase [Candidatus Magnetomoraceae bacterium gMMP-15]